MEVKVHRKYRNVKNGTRVYCIDNVYVNGKYICDAIEDKDYGWDKNTPLSTIQSIKAKNPSKTAIPKGKYQVTLDIVSPKYGKVTYYKNLCGGKVPRLLNVPGFDGILIHKGNTEKDSAGCIIVGYNTIKGMVTNSWKAFESLYKLFSEARVKGETIWLYVE